MVAAIADAVADKIGDLNSFHHLLESAGAALKEHSWSWTSVGDTLLSVVSYLAYFILYITVFRPGATTQGPLDQIPWSACASI